MRYGRLLLIAGLSFVGACAFAGSRSEQSGELVEPPAISLHEAVVLGDTKAIEQHIAAGSDINARDDYGSTPLIVAAIFGMPDAARVLLAAGADTALANDEGSSPLHIAAFLCRTEIVGELLRAGADRKAINFAGRTPLQSVSAPFEEVQAIYDGIAHSLAPLGLRLDLERIQETRPVVADMLRA